MKNFCYKFLRDVDGVIKSDSGDCTWAMDEWQSVDEVMMCESGFHCSRQVYQAFSFVQGEILAEVEVDGQSIINEDKEAWQRMRIVRAWKWQKQDSVALAVFAAELVLDNYEKCYPDDTRPREAIEAAKAWQNASIEERESAAESTRAAAWSAAESAWSARAAARAAAESAWAAAESARAAAWAAESAWSAAESAAWSAGSAAGSAAESAAGSAAESAAWSAAWSARSAAWSAARSALIEKIAQWMDERVVVLEEWFIITSTVGA